MPGTARSNGWVMLSVAMAAALRVHCAGAV
jgi:hypothetical protein